MVASPLDRSISSPLADRWMFVAMAGLFAFVAVAGFGPKSIDIVQGSAPNPPLVIHVHAALMASWLGLLLTQSVLAATGRMALHRSLGIAGLIVAPCLVMGMIGAAIWRFHQRAELQQFVPAANTFFFQSRAIVGFALFFTWAMVVRKSDTKTHRRMMLLATWVVMGASISRMSGIPTTLPGSPLAMHIYMLLLLAPALLFDLVRDGRIHRSYVYGLALFVPWAIVTHLLWSTPVWVRGVSALMGY